MKENKIKENKIKENKIKENKIKENKMKENKEATLKDFGRLCAAYESCSDCPISDIDGCCPESILEHLDEVNTIITKWCEEHPTKTRQDKFLEMYPNATLVQGVVDICPSKVDSEFVSLDCGTIFCGDCMKEYWFCEVE